jgi:hypothetical protein
MDRTCSNNQHTISNDTLVKRCINCTSSASGILIPIFLFALMFFGIGSPNAMAQGAPPFTTNDPDTPGNKLWENNVGFVPTHLSNGWIHEAPQLDLNYGVGDKIQLTFCNSWMILRQRPESAEPGELPPPMATVSGISQGEFGVKWRFYDNKMNGLAVSFFPQVAFNYPGHGVERGINEPGMSVLLPFQFAKSAGPVNFVWEVGYNYSHLGDNVYLAGIIAGHDFTKKLNLGVEVFSEGAFNGSDQLTTIGVGGSYPLSSRVNFLFMAGRSVKKVSESQPNLIGYFGLQFLLPHGPPED